MHFKSIHATQKLFCSDVTGDCVCPFQLIKIVEDLGVDVNSIINLIHEVIGLPPYAVRKNTRRGVGINGLINDLIAILPVDDLKALFEEKQKSSPDFKALIDVIQSPEFKVNIQHLNLVLQMLIDSQCTAWTYFYQTIYVTGVSPCLTEHSRRIGIPTRVPESATVSAEQGS